MDEKLLKMIINELIRQQNNIELIASENFVSKEIMQIQGSILTNKYAEGYPDKRYYGGCTNVDEIETLAISYACKLFKCKYANVQPHSGSSANMAVYKALLNPGDKVLGMNLNHGGHLTHGHKVNFSGLEYKTIYYNVNANGLIDYDNLIEIATREKPKMIIAGASAYSRFIDFKKFREAADKCGAILMVDMAHIAGLVATGHHPSPFPYADIVTSTTHKTLRGPRGGLILTNDEEIIRKINKTVFPGLQGGPLMHVIAAKAQCFYEASRPDFKAYIDQVILNSKALAQTVSDHGFSIISGGTDNHLFLVDVKNKYNLTGNEAEHILESINITCNKNMIPYDQELPNKTSGIRLGSAAMTTRGLKEEDFIQIGNIICFALKNKDNKEYLSELKEQVKKIIDKYPLYGDVKYGNNN